MSKRRSRSASGMLQSQGSGQGTWAPSSPFVGKASLIDVIAGVDALAKNPPLPRMSDELMPSATTLPAPPPRACARACAARAVRAARHDPDHLRHLHGAAGLPADGTAGRRRPSGSSAWSRTAGMSRGARCCSSPRSVRRPLHRAHRLLQDLGLGGGRPRSDHRLPHGRRDARPRRHLQRRLRQPGGGAGGLAHLRRALRPHRGHHPRGRPAAPTSSTA